MSVSRRKFLRAGTLVAVSAGFPLKSLVAATLSQPSSILPTNNPLNSGLYLQQETFARQLNTMFRFSHKEIEVNVKLIEVNDLTSGTAAKSGKECFALVFRGSHNAPVRQETYSVTHEAIGKFDMLVVPLAKNNEGVYYEAFFNRLH